MRRLQEGGAHFFLNGIRFRVFGDPTTEYCRNMMLVAQIDLQKLKDRSDESLTIIDHEVGPYFRVRSRNGQDEIFIYPEVVKGKKVVEQELITEEKDEESITELLPMYEVYDKNLNQIGYIVCKHLSWDPDMLWLTDNVIYGMLTKEEAAEERAANPNITVDPFLWPVWKGYYTEVDGVENKPFDGVLKNKDLTKYYPPELVRVSPDVESVSIIVTEIASKFEECIMELWEFYDLDESIADQTTIYEYDNSWASDFERIDLEYRNETDEHNLLATYCKRGLNVNLSWYEDNPYYMYMTRDNYTSFYVCDWTEYELNNGMDWGWREVGRYGFWYGPNIDSFLVDYTDEGWEYLYAQQDIAYEDTVANFKEPNEYTINFTLEGLYTVFAGGTGQWYTDRLGSHMQRVNYASDCTWLTRPTWCNCKDLSKYVHVAQWWNTTDEWTNDSTWHYLPEGSLITEVYSSHRASWSECIFTHTITHPYKLVIYINGIEWVYKSGSHDDEESRCADDYVQDVNARYYEIGDDGNFVVLISIFNRKYGWATGDSWPRKIYFIYDSVSGEMKGLDDKWSYNTIKGESTYPYYYKYHMIPGFQDVNGDPVYGSGEFRLIERTISIKYKPTKSKISFQPVEI